MSYTLSLSGRGSMLECTYFPPIPLTGEWEIGLLNLETYHSIPNLSTAFFVVDSRESESEDVNNKFEILTKDSEILSSEVAAYFSGNEFMPVFIPPGTYEVEDIEDFINRTLRDKALRIKPNKNTLKIEITCLKSIYISAELACMLGFSTHMVFLKGKHYTAPYTAKVNSINVISVECNVSSGSYLNAKPTHSIHEFVPEVAPGYKIINIPTTVIYYPINTTALDLITIELKDQSGKTVDLRSEELTVRVHLRKVKS